MNAAPRKGPADAKAMLIGQNPGTEENKSGRPFMSISCKFLNSVLDRRGLSRDSLFLTDILKH
jgi:uracil-DNA glycosylase family 4